MGIPMNPWSPLEQFTIRKLVDIGVGKFDMSITNSTIFLLISTAFIFLFFFYQTQLGGKALPSKASNILDMNFSFINTMVKEQIGSHGSPYFPFILILFLFLMTNNVLGMVPYAFTTTSHISVTFTFSLSLFIGITIIGFHRHGLHFFSFLFPPGAPLALAPLLVVLELVSYSFRAVSLGVRLFANMMAGHTLVKILAGFGWNMQQVGGFLGALALLPYLIVYALIGLELGVAFLQAYVFTILITIYINDVIHLH